MMANPDEIREIYATGQATPLSEEEVKRLFDSLPSAIDMQKAFEGKVQISDEQIDEARKIFVKAYEGIISFLDSWVDIPKGQKHIVALWLIGTYMHKQFETYPFLFFNAMKGSGKTRLLKIISHLQHNGTGDLLNNASESVVFRTAQNTGLIFDEFESIGGKEKQTLREILNASYKKGGKVPRMHKVFTKEGENQKVEYFELFTPVAMANIWGMDEVLEDRCITLILEKSSKDHIVKKIENFGNNEEMKDLKTLLNNRLVFKCRVVTLQGTVKEWNNYIDNKYNNDIMTYTTTTTLNDTTTLTQLNKLNLFNKIDEMNISGRMLELMFPLLMISYFIGEENLLQTLTFVKETLENKKGEEMTESKDVMVLSFISKRDLGYETEFHSLLELAREFKNFVGEFEDSDYNWANAKWLGRALKRLSLIQEKRRLAHGREVKLYIQKAKEKLKIFKTDEEIKNESIP